MWNDPAPVINRELGPGERVLWSGQPLPGIRLRASDAFVIPFTILWCGFAIFWESMAVTKGAPVFFMLWGVPFVLVGLYLVFGRFFVDARNRGRTYYGVTNERVIIVNGRQIKSLQLRALSEMTLSERGDSHGTITFGPQLPMGRRMPAGWPGSSQYAPPAFDMIEGAKRVYEIIRQAQRESSKTLPVGS